MMRRIALPVGLALATLLTATLARPVAYEWRLPPGVAPPPVPADNPLTTAKIALGRRLFYDADLSLDGTTSCATCHEQHRAFSDGNATHGGIQGAKGRRNAMALANIAYFTPLTWADPSLHTLESQIPVPLEGTHPVEMGMAGHGEELVRRLAANACYQRAFAAAFPETGGRIDMVGVRRALASFERTLLSFDAPYDRYRRGDGGAISSAAKRGAALFLGKLHCSACHDGDNFTDRHFHAIGLYNVDSRGGYPASDHGLREITGRVQDEGAFRTPSLRNVALTAPYMHDGSVASLPEAIQHHLNRNDPDVRHTPKHITDAELADLNAFLESLSDANFVTDPQLSLPPPGC